MIYNILGEQPFQVLSDSFSVSPSESGYNLYLSADGVNYSQFAAVASGVTRQFTGMNNGNYYILSGNTSDVQVNWNRDCRGGGGGAAGVSSLDGQTGALTTKTINGNAILGEGDIEIQTGSSATVIDFDSTSQQDRASLYTALKALYDGGSGDTINKNYIFYKTAGTRQSVRFEYYTFSGDVLTLGTVVAPTDSSASAYEQVLMIESNGLVSISYNAIGGGGNYVIVDALSAITSPVEGMIAYVPAHNETYTGYTISNADGNLYGQVYLKHYNPREHSMMVYEQYDEGFISVKQGASAYSFYNDDVFRYIYRNQVALKYDDTDKLFTILYKPGRFQMQIGVSQEYYSETSGNVQVPAQMYIYKYGKWHLYEDGKISYYLNTISEAEYDEMYQDIPQMSEGEVQFIVDDYYYGWSTYRFKTSSSQFTNGSFYGHTFFCKASNGENMDDNNALSIRVGWSQNYKVWYFAKYSNFVGVQQTLTGGTKIGTVTVNGVGTDLYAPEGGATVQYLTEDTWTGAYWEIGTELPEGGSWGVSIRRPDYTEIFETYQRQNEVVVMGEGNIGNTGSIEGNLTITDGNEHIMLDGQGNRYVFKMDFSNGVLYFYHSPDQTGNFTYEGAQGKSYTTGSTEGIVHLELAKVLSGNSWIQKDEILFPKTYFIDDMTDAERVALYNLIKYSGPKISPIGKFCRFFSKIEDKDGFMGMCEVYFCRFDGENLLSFSGNAISRNSDILFKVKFNITNDGSLSGKTITEYSLTVNS